MPNSKSPLDLQLLLFIELLHATMPIHDETILLDIHLNNEEGLGWTEGEGLLSGLLPLYDEIKTGNYQFLRLVKAIHKEFNGEKNAIRNPINETILLSAAQERFIACIGSDL
jgi:hypothetical protein